jgi:group I intron endonuclease
MRNVYIYKLICPTTNEIKYVGKTLRLEKRRSEHNMFKSKKSLSKVEKWENELISNGYKPIFEVIEICSEHEWEQREIFWIKYFKDNNITLLNMTVGGDGVNQPITKNHNSNFLKGNKLEDYYSIEKSLDIRNKISQKSRGINNPNYGGKLLTKEYLDKQSISNSKIPLKVIDTITKEEFIFKNSKDAAEYLNCSRSSIRENKKSGYLIRKRFKIENL